MGTSSTHLQSQPGLFVVSGEESGLLSRLPLLLSLSAVAWLLATLPVFRALYHLWSTDPLRSIGMFFPVLSLILVAHTWRSLGWERNGSWWGLLPLALTVAALWMRTGYLMQWIVTPSFYINLLPEGLLLALPLSAGILLLGGVRVWRKCLFPIALLLCVNPVPRAFNSFLDLPLQHASAATARRFAILIGERPDGEQLRLMFTPDFGMFIAPGCNGIRGAITLGYVSLLASYWRGFSLPIQALSAIAGIAMGYLFNFLRLCLLVVYYKVGRFVPAIQPHGALIDYIIGGSLFLFASICFGLVFFRSNAQPAENERILPHRPARHSALMASSFLAVIALFALLNLRMVVHDAREASLFTRHSESVARLPQTSGAFHLATQWTEGDYLWGRYSDGQPADDLTLGLWSADGYHDALTCHLARGEKTTTAEPIIHTTAQSGATTYRTFTYDDGLTNVFAASRICPNCTILDSPVRLFGRLRIVEHPTTNFFRNPTIAGIVLLHEAAPGYAPIQTFIAGLDESALLTISKK